MDEQWLCNANVWDGREICDLCAAASTLRGVCLHVAGGLFVGAGEETLLDTIMVPVKHKSSIFYDQV